MKTEKNRHNCWIIHIQISLSANFQFKLTIAIFEPNLAKKGSYFQSKLEKIDITIEIFIFELVFISNFTLNKQFSILKPNFPRKDICRQKTEKVNITIESRIFKLVFVPNFRLNWQFWFYWPYFPRKAFSGLKQQKRTPHIFCIILHIQISLVGNFKLKISLFWTKFAQKSIFSRKQKNWTSPWNSA